jgi:hypothetical protein
MRMTLKHWINRHLADAFTAWHLNGQEMRRRRLLIQKVVARWTHQSSAHAFENWLNHAKIQKKYRIVGSKIIKRWTHQVILLAVCH